MKKHTEFPDMMALEREKQNFEPYGFSCIKFSPVIMPRLDRHNEIEIIYALGGSVTYFFQDRSVVVPPHCLAILWGMFPHRIIELNGVRAFYLVSIPLSQFLCMGLPDAFMNQLFKGEILMDEDSQRFVHYDQQLLENWWMDYSASSSDMQAMMLELQGRLIRMANHVLSGSVLGLSMSASEVNLVERMTLYIAANYHRPIKVADVGRAVGLHPDYANTMFKKTFGHTLSYHLALERITQAQRKLLITSDSIVQIAEACGFNSISCFNSAFLKFNGCTPRDYRKHFLNRGAD